MAKTQAKRLLLDNFPTGYTPTDIQVKTLQQIQEALDDDKHKFIIICAPTGSGKSVLARTLANVTPDPRPEQVEMIMDYTVWETDQFGNYTNTDDYMLFPKFGGFVLTVSKQLQAQYQNLFKDTKILMGKGNYQCQVDLNYDVETAPCVLAPKIKFKCWEENLCPYFNARNHAIASKFAALNYKMFLALPYHVKFRDTIICDEASELEEELVKQFSATITYSVLKFLGVEHKVLVTDMPGRVLTWVSELLDHTESQIKHLKERSANKISDSDKIKLKLLFQLQSQLGGIVDHWNESEYCIEKDIKKVTLTPLKVNKLSRHIFEYADKVVLLSATIIDHANFAHTLGIKDYKYIEVPSTFDSKKSPIYTSKRVCLNYKTLKDGLPIIAKQISQLLANHAEQKGIIHTHSNEITTILKVLLEEDPQFSRLLIRDSESTNKDILEKHIKSSVPTVLVSPSLTFGVDLVGDLSRFQILCKAPFSPLGNKRIKTLFEEDKNWYTDQCLKAIVQACGRSTRSIEDWSATYILDGTAVDLIVRNKEKLPKSFIDRFA